MTTRLKTLISAATAAIALTGVTAAHAYVITFEDMTGPSNVTLPAGSTSSETIVETTPIGNVTFTGGYLLTGETNLPADQTSLYYDSYLLGASDGTITVTFPQAVSNFALDVYNGELNSDSFTVSNGVNSVTDTIPANTSNGYTLVSLPQGGTTFTITGANESGYDFSIDNVAFNQAVPEPGAWVLMLAGFGLAGGALRARARAARSAAV